MDFFIFVFNIVRYGVIQHFVQSSASISPYPFCYTNHLHVLPHYFHEPSLCGRPLFLLAAPFSTTFCLIHLRSLFCICPNHLNLALS